ncbi:MAG: SHOCT domain-containing protein [Coraliomargarita sp.]
MKTSITLLALLTALAFNAGCGSTKTNVESSQTTGQELLDLKAAYDDGIITEKEYERKKKEILKD